MNKWLPVVGLALFGVLLSLKDRTMKVPKFTQLNASLPKEENQGEGSLPKQNGQPPASGLPAREPSEPSSEKPMGIVTKKVESSLINQAPAGIAHAAPRLPLAISLNPTAHLSALTAEHAYDLDQAFINKYNWDRSDETVRLYFGQFSGYAYSDQGRLPIKMELSENFTGADNCVIASMEREGIVAGFLSDETLEIWRTERDEHSLIFYMSGESPLYLFTMVDQRQVSGS